MFLGSMPTSAQEIGGGFSFSQLVSTKAQTVFSVPGVSGHVCMPFKQISCASCRCTSSGCSIRDISIYRFNTYLCKHMGNDVQYLDIYIYIYIFFSNGISTWYLRERTQHFFKHRHDISSTAETKICTADQMVWPQQNSTWLPDVSHSAVGPWELFIFWRNGNSVGLYLTEVSALLGLPENAIPWAWRNRCTRPPKQSLVFWKLRLLRPEPRWVTSSEGRYRSKDPFPRCSCSWEQSQCL